MAPQSDPALRERNFGQAQGRPHGELASAASGIEIDRVVDADARPAEGESLTELYERVATFIDELETRAPEGDVLVVTHGGVIRVAQAYCDGIPAAAMAWGPVPNASVWGRQPAPSVHCDRAVTQSRRESEERVMRPTMLQLPQRTSKPRADGLTMMVDGGLPTRQFQDVVESGAEFLDFVKFGWGTAIVTTDLQRKIDVLDDVGVDFYFGGTLFEKFVLQDRFDDFRDLCLSYGCRYVEVSNGTIDLSHIEKAGYVRKLAGDFKVVSEVGFKDSERSELLAPDRWIECIHEDLEAGAFLVTLESRESGSSGICRPNGELRFGLIEEILDSDVNPSQLLFEAPSTQLQCYFVRRIGSDVNLGNIPSTALLGLETIRLGLRADTLECFESAVS